MAPRIIELARANASPIALQTNLFFGGRGQGAACGDRFGSAVACNEGAYLKLLQNGIRPAGGAGPDTQARYIEVFPADAIAYPAAIAAAHAALAR